MNDDELSKRLQVFQQRLEVAQHDVGASGLVVYSFMVGDQEDGSPSMIGGESLSCPGSTSANAVEISYATMVGLMGYLWGRLEILKQESSAQFGPEFSVLLQREVQGQMRQGSAMGQFGFQTALGDLVRSYKPSIAIGSTVGSSGNRGEPAAFMSTESRATADLVPAFAALKRGYRELLDHTAKHSGMSVEKFSAMVDALCE